MTEEKRDEEIKEVKYITALLEKLKQDGVKLTERDEGYLECLFEKRMRPST